VFEAAICKDFSCNWQKTQEYNNAKALACACNPHTLDADFPTLQLNLGIGERSHNIRLRPSDYMIQNRNLCTVSFTPRSDLNNTWVLGNLFNRVHF